MIVRVTRSEISGRVVAPPSKSYTHRALICGLLACGTTHVKRPLLCNDTMATINAARLMGAEVDVSRDLRIRSDGELRQPTVPVDCGESGTTMRLFMGLAALIRGKTILRGGRTLFRRPNTDLMDALQQLGAKTVSLGGNGLPPIEVDGTGLRGGHARLRGDVSSQFISALLFACSRANGGSQIELMTRLESRPYAEMTLEVMREFGACAYPENDWRLVDIPGEQAYQAHDYTVQGDYSSAAFLLAAGALRGRCVVERLSQTSSQGDLRIVDILREMGASVHTTAERVSVESNTLHPIDIDVSDTPDLVPILAVLASQAQGRSTLQGVERLKIKESDRLVAISEELSKMNAKIEANSDALIIEGPRQLHGAVINAHSDHRIAMACTVAGMTADGATVILDAECVAKSYPEFFSDMQSIGARIETLQQG